jgi:molybdenum cofactor cytidylyltransferase
MLSVIVLAAGLSNRMGDKNKLLLPFQGKTILETTIYNILEADIGDVIVVVGHEAEKVKNVLENYPLPKESGCTISIVHNFDYQKGMTTSIQTGICAPQPQRGDGENQNTEGYMICLSDMVLIEPYEYQLLAQQFLLSTDEKVIIQPVFKEKRGNPVIFSSFYKNAILETTDTDGTSRDNREGCRSVVQAHKKHVKWVEMPTNHVLQDVDFKEDYERILKN